MVPLSTENQANLQNYRVRIKNNREWSEDQKYTRVETEYEYEYQGDRKKKSVNKGNKRERKLIKGIEKLR